VGKIAGEQRSRGAGERHACPRGAGVQGSGGAEEKLKVKKISLFTIHYSLSPLLLCSSAPLPPHPTPHTPHPTPYTLHPTPETQPSAPPRLSIRIKNL